MVSLKIKKILKTERNCFRPDVCETVFVYI